MSEELAKIEFYFQEGARFWTIDPEKTLSRGFYELWETVQQPRPFRLAGDTVTLAGLVFPLAADDAPERVAYFQWDNSDGRASLIVEGRLCLDKFTLTFQDGEPLVIENEPEFFESVGLEHGERLEIIYDLIAHLRADAHGRNPLDIGKKEYLETLDAIASRYAPEAVRIMRQQTLRFVKNLIRQASEDMTMDELSGQLSLPLGGTYAAGSLTARGDDGEPSTVGPPVIQVVIPAQGRWPITRELELLKVAAEKVAESEQAFILALSEAELLNGDGRSPGQDYLFKVQVSRSAPIQEADQLLVFLRGENAPRGTFFVDLFDGPTVYGRLRWDGAEDLTLIKGRLYGRPPRSANAYLTAAMTALFQEFQLPRYRPSGALAATLGLCDVSVFDGADRRAPDSLDFSQARAWRRATMDENRVVLIQGPPGTGKTRTLESVLRDLVARGKRVLVTAPSNTAVDNICARVLDLPLLRVAGMVESVDPNVAERCWAGDEAHVRRYLSAGDEGRGTIIAGTHVGVIKDTFIRQEIEKKGPFDVILFDEAGMARVGEFLLCCQSADRAVLFGDHQQLPPFPLPTEVMSALDAEQGPLTRPMKTLLVRSALEWLLERGFPVLTLSRSYRCQNPRLLRFASTLFYNAAVKPSENAEYFRLPYIEREAKYSALTLRLYNTGQLPPALRRERLIFEGQKPGIENPTEALICARTIYALAKKYPLEEITVISPYRLQVKKIRDALSREAMEKVAAAAINMKRWKDFLFSRIATVDSFQGGESDAVIISYVRSNAGTGIGFVDDPNRVNVAHTRCRREMIVIADVDCLKAQTASNIFTRMERAFRRDGEVIDVTPEMLKQASDFAKSLEAE